MINPSLDLIGSTIYLVESFPDWDYESTNCGTCGHRTTEALNERLCWQTQTTKVVGIGVTSVFTQQELQPDSWGSDEFIREIKDLSLVFLTADEAEKFIEEQTK